MNSDYYLVSAGLIGIVGVAALYQYRKHSKQVSSQITVAKHNTSLPDAADKLTVQAHHELIQNLDLTKIIGRLQNRSGFECNIFEKDCLPVIYRLADWCQLLPASESHHHAQPGGLLIHILETAEFALQARQGFLLPAGAPPEEVPARKHRWTYGVFIAAMLHDIGKVISDLNILTFDKDQRSTGPWQPLAGSMLDQNIAYYQVSFEVANKNYGLHQKLPIILMQRLLPDHALSWIAQDQELMQELSTYLSGDENYQGMLKRIASTGDSESVKRNLLTGSRTRFSTAKTIPLIERLMQALRMMLSEGVLTLNRAGAHGWVYDGKIWFVSKRIADAVRGFIIERESKVGIPGPDKNDRLFDTWQEYGAIIDTPDHKAIWLVTIDLEDGWKQDMTVLCFPLEKLYRTPDQYPAPMRGKVTPVGMTLSADSNKTGPINQPIIDTSGAILDSVTNTNITGASTQNVSSNKNIGPEINQLLTVSSDHIDVPEIEAPDFIPESAYLSNEQSAPEQATQQKTDAISQTLNTEPASTQSEKSAKPKKKKPPKDNSALPSINLKSLEQALAKPEAIAPVIEPIIEHTEPVDDFMSGAVEIVEPDFIPEPTAQQKNMAKIVEELDILLEQKKVIEPSNDDDEFLDDFDAASTEPVSIPDAATLKPVSPAGQTSFNPRWNKDKKAPNEAALRFMRWIQEGLAHGDIPYNRTDSLIHFMDEGMMLVSPKIFREFASKFGEDGDGKPTDKQGVAIGTGIQRHVFNAGWHQQTGAEKKNIQKFRVVGHNGAGKHIINGVLILNPEQFVNPVPESNQSIKPFDLNFTQ